MAKCAAVVEDTLKFVWNVLAEFVDHLFPVSLEPKCFLVSIPFSVTALSVFHAPSADR